MSAADEAPAPPELPPVWQRLERAAREAAALLPVWRRRALDAEEEVARLRHALESLGGERKDSGDVTEEVRRLRAENAALRSRMAQARRRVRAMLTRLGTLESER